MPSYEMDREQLLKLIRYDCVTFLGFYLGEELEMEVPAFHQELWEEILELLEQINSPEHVTGILHKLIAVPREHAKTTLTKLAVLLMLRYSKLSFCAYTSNTFGVALSAIRDIKDYFMSEQDTALYGVTKSTKSSESEGLYILQVPVPGQPKLKTVILKSFGQGTQLRGTLLAGRRPDILIFDDIESKETAESPVQQAKLDAWCLGTALKAMARRGVCIFIGNMIADTTLLARLSKEESWRPTVLGALVKAGDSVVPLWPGRWSLEDLLTDYSFYRRIGQGHTWEAELMNLTSGEVFGESLEDAVRPVKPMPEELVAGFLCLDPAFGKNAWNDESAITVHGLVRGASIPAVLESATGRWSEEEVFDELMAMSFRWGISTWVIEAQAAQRLLIPLFRLLMTQRKISSEAFLLLGVLAGKESKASRILAFRSAVAAGSYGIVESEQDLVEKLEGYSPLAKDHDDLCDSAAYGTVIWELHGDTVEAKGIINVAGLLFNNAQEQAGMGALELGIP